MKRLPTRSRAEIDAALPGVLRQLRSDGLIAYPTETVYGFGGATSERAVQRLRALKRREALKPFLLLVPSPDQAPGVQWSAAARAVAQRFWPGPLTLALPAVPNGFPQGIISSEGTVALRASPHPFVRALMAAWQAPITSTSANAPGSPPARDADGVLAALEEIGVRDVLVLDAGRLPESAPSTIVAVADHRVRVLRAGAIGIDELRNELSGIGIHVE
ncbi:MAG TPA: L-threonylcarbamoyladenylate synthase [Longimicrobiales bacterium]